MVDVRMAPADPSAAAVALDRGLWGLLVASTAEPHEVVNVLGRVMAHYLVRPDGPDGPDKATFGRMLMAFEGVAAQVGACIRARGWTPDQCGIPAGAPRPANGPH